ncbi:MAG TPA: F0F1 ATP synthase subunit gamma [Buchnera sp. (in: enterobacteria)]|nr:F0F1 ATP synthase subunit gamma [Buchnera sp. (in: enterobacteria)]
MAAEKEVRNKINSIINTKKITKAMEMVSIAKMRKAESQLYASRPYFKSIKTIIHNLQNSSLKYQHCYFKNKVISKRIAFIIVSTDRGLCGSLNSNLFKKILEVIQIYDKKKILCDFIIFGLKGYMFFNALHSNIFSKVINFGQVSNLSKFSYSIEKILSRYKMGSVDKLFLAYNKFNNTIHQIPIVTKLLPISIKDIKKMNKNSIWDYIYEPNAKFILDTLLYRYIESQIYQGILENITSEHAARIIAMHTATDNSDHLIQELQLIYNKTRQASITRELTEIVSGASAVSLDH